MATDQKYKLEKDFGSYAASNLASRTRMEWADMMFPSHNQISRITMFDHLLEAGFFSPVQEEKEERIRVEGFYSECETLFHLELSRHPTDEEFSIAYDQREAFINGELLTREQAEKDAKDFMFWVVDSVDYDHVNDLYPDILYKHWLSERSKQ